MKDCTGKNLQKGDKIIYNGKLFTITAISETHNVILIETDTLRLIKSPLLVNKFIEIGKPDEESN